MRSDHDYTRLYTNMLIQLYEKTDQPDKAAEYRSNERDKQTGDSHQNPLRQQAGQEREEEARLSTGWQGR